MSTKRPKTNVLALVAPPTNETYIEATIGPKKQKCISWGMGARNERSVGGRSSILHDLGGRSLLRGDERRGPEVDQVGEASGVLDAGRALPGQLGRFSRVPPEIRHSHRRVVLQRSDEVPLR